MPELVDLDGWVTPPDPGRLATCHCDVNVENVRRRQGGGIAVLDWENSGPAQPERQRAAILADLAADLSLTEATAAYHAYRRTDGPATVSEPADFSTAIAVQGHLLRFYADRALDHRQPAEDRTRARRRLARMLNPPLTTAGISQLLDALHA